MRSIDIARQYLGFTETKNRIEFMNLFAHAGIRLDPATTPWCAAFVNGCEWAAGNQGNKKVNARSFVVYGNEVSDWNQAQEGDILVFPRGNNPWEGHVTFFVEWDDDKNLVKCLGGNQGDSVSYAFYNQDDILEIRRPPNASNKP